MKNNNRNHIYSIMLTRRRMPKHVNASQ